MPTTSDTVPQTIFLETTAGVAAVYASKTAFLAAGWALSWVDKDNVALTSQPTWTLAAGEASGRHVIGYPIPAGAWTCKITWPSGYRSDPAEFDGFGATYDADDLYAGLSASAGVAISPVTTEGDVDLYDGRSIIIDLSVLEAALTYIGASSLADCSSLTAEIKLIANNSDDPADVTTLVESILSDVSGTRTVRATLAAFPAALAVPDGEKSVSARCDLKLTKGGLTVVGATRNVTILWKANS